MHAYLIIGKTKTLVNEKARKLAQEKNAILTPFTLQKIADVRNLSHLTKLSLHSPTAFYVSEIEKVSTDALNAFLKQLEEPRANTFFILSATSEDKVLPTIVSRCQVIKVQSAQDTVQSTRISSFSDLTIGQQLTFIDKIKKRDEAIEFLQESIQGLHKKLISHPSSVTSFQLEELGRTLTALEKNGNVTIQLTRMVVGINKNNF